MTASKIAKLPTMSAFSKNPPNTDAVAVGHDEFHERQRLDQLACTNLLDTPSSESFDQITRLASQMFNTPIALVSLVDSDRQWFKSHHGLDVRETEREFSFCARAIERHEVMVVEDATQDPRFASNPLVTGEPHIRFYAGAPLVLPSGHALGSLCVIDQKPRRFSTLERQQLITLATFVMSQIELHRQAGRVNEITRLPNRTQLADDLERETLLHPGESRGLLLIEVIEHQRLQDTVRAVGVAPLEATLRDVAMRLRKIVGGFQPVYHVSETRFCVQMPEGSREERQTFCKLTIEQLEEPFHSGGVHVELEVAAGLVEFDLTERGGADALRKATSAMHEAAAHSEKFRWYDDALDSLHNRAYRLMRAVSEGLLEGEFRLVYQPKFNITTASFTGVEALARWRHPNLGDISPGEFIPLIEKTALIHEFTRWALVQALQQARDWQKAGVALTVAVNVSSRNLNDPSFVSDIAEICVQVGIDPQWLHVECTETDVLTSEPTRLALAQLQSMGAEVSLDDFGMGYSNLSCRRNLPVKLLKLDQSLVKPMETDVTSYELAKSLISLGHSLGFGIVAEGVETLRACSLLIEAGCDSLQGYYLAKPMEAESVVRFMSNPSSIPHLRSDD